MFGRIGCTVLLAGALLAPPAVAGNGATATKVPVKTVVQSFHLKYRTAGEASDVAQVFLSKAGSVTVHPAQATVTVQDTPRSVRRIGQVLEVFDQPQPRMRVEVRLIEASNLPPEAGDPQSAGLDPRIRKMFHYTRYTTIGQAVLQWDAPGPMEVDLGHRYRLSTRAAWQQRLGVAATTSSSRDVLQAKDLRLAWKLGGPATLRGMLRSQRLVLEELTLTPDRTPNGRPLLRTRAVLAPRQQVIIGASPSEGSDRALVLILRALDPGKQPGGS
ncbi:MAG: hypothetical protein GXP47_05910 [Acidobacteria bacterium]|nr:hypothetical protein [Acidobacteriota bacterium]